MRAVATALAIALIGLAAPAGAQDEDGAEETRTAEQYIERAREVYSVTRREADPCPEAVGNEIVVCRRFEDPDELRVESPTRRAYLAEKPPPDPIPAAPYVLGLPECGVEVTCHRIGRAPPPIYIIDLSKIPVALTPEEARHVYRAEDLPPETSSEEALPAAAP